MDEGVKAIRANYDAFEAKIKSLEEKALPAFNSEIKEELAALKEAALGGEANIEDTWNKASDEKRTVLRNLLQAELPEQAEAIAAKLETHGIYKKGAWIVTIVGFGLLLLLGSLYLYLHNEKNATFYNKADERAFFTALGSAQTELTKTIPNWQTIGVAIRQFPDVSDNLLVCGFHDQIAVLQGMVGPESKLQPQTETSPPAQKLINKQAVAKPKRGKSTDNFAKAKQGVPVDTVIEKDPRVKPIQEIIDKIAKDAKQLAESAGYFWIGGFWRWLEIVFWGEFGVVTGILVYVGTQAANNNYTRFIFERERYWYLIEVIIGPFVVIAVFLLLQQFIGTFMDGITSDQVHSSIYLTLGISFTLGLFVRRTLGLFSVIKNKLPLPTS